MITIDDYLRTMETTFVPERTIGKHAVLQYVFTGSQTGACYALIDDGRLSVTRGEHPAPSVTASCDFDLFLRIVAYEEDGLLAYQDGKYRVAGDILMLMDSER